MNLVTIKKDYIKSMHRSFLFSSLLFLIAPINVLIYAFALSMSGLPTLFYGFIIYHGRIMRVGWFIRLVVGLLPICIYSLCALMMLITNEYISLQGEVLFVSYIIGPVCGILGIYRFFFCKNYLEVYLEE